MRSTYRPGIPSKIIIILKLNPLNPQLNLNIHKVLLIKKQQILINRFLFTVSSNLLHFIKKTKTLNKLPQLKYKMFTA